MTIKKIKPKTLKPTGKASGGRIGKQFGGGLAPPLGGPGVARPLGVAGAAGSLGARRFGKGGSSKK